MISANSLVGTHIFASVLRQMHRPFEFIYGHPENADAPQKLSEHHSSEHHSSGHTKDGLSVAGGDDAEGLVPMRRQFEDAVSVAQAVHRVRTCAVGLIGYHAPGFINMAVHSSLISDNLGATLYHDGLHAFFDMLPNVTEDRVNADVNAFSKLGLPYDERLTALDKKAEATEKVSEIMALASRIYLTLKDYISENGLDALAIRDWPEFPNVLGQWPYVAISRLASEGFAVAPEGDVDGALGSLLAEELGMGPLYISDWLEHDNATAVLWHAGAAPIELCGPIGSKTGPRISAHFNNKKPAVIDGAFRADVPVTVFRLWQCDGAYKLAGFEAMTAKPYRPLYGNNCRIEVKGFSLGDWFETMLGEGMPHHVTLAPGHNLYKLRRVSRLLGIKWV